MYHCVFMYHYLERESRILLFIDLVATIHSYGVVVVPVPRGRNSYRYMYMYRYRGRSTAVRGRVGAERVHVHVV